MKIMALAFLLPSLCFAGDWSREDTYRQSAFTALMIADWAQTRTAAKRPDRYTETNNILRDHPSIGRVNNYFAISVASHAAVSHMLPPQWRKAWQYMWIGIETNVVYRNYAVGVRVAF